MKKIDTPPCVWICPAPTFGFFCRKASVTCMHICDFTVAHTEPHSLRDICRPGTTVVVLLGYPSWLAGHVVPLPSRESMHYEQSVGLKPAYRAIT